MTILQERLVEWLRDAHAAEEQAETMLRHTAKQTEDYPLFAAGLNRHSELSGQQAKQLKICLESLGEGTSLVKNITGQLTALGQTVSGFIVGDEPVKAALATATFAHMEVSSYRILVVAAEAAGKAEIAAICKERLQEELDFCAWMDEQLKAVTAEYLAQGTHSGAGTDPARSA